MKILLAVAQSFALALVVAGCTSQYSVKVDGDVQGTDKDTPRVVKSTIHEGSEARATREAAKGHLRALTDARVTISLKFKKEPEPRAVTQKVDSRTAEFHFEEKGEASGPLTGVLIKVEAPGRQPVERLFPHPGEMPFEAVLMAVLDEAGPGSGAPAEPPADASKPDASKPAGGTPAGK